MTKYSFVYTLAAASFLAAGCSTDALPIGPGFIPAENSIASYVDPLETQAAITYWHQATGQSGDGRATYDNMQIDLYVGGIDPIRLITPRTDAKTYDSLTRAHRDYDYGGNPALSASEVLYKGITGLDIVSDTDYDAAHPAGASLNDLFSLSLQEVVRGAADGIPAYVFEVKTYPTVADLPAQGGPHLLGRLLVLKPLKAPAATATHVFRIHYRNEAGKELVAWTKAFTIVKE